MDNATNQIRHTEWEDFPHGFTPLGFPVRGMSLRSARRFAENIERRKQRRQGKRP